MNLAWIPIEVFDPKSCTKNDYNVSKGFLIDCDMFECHNWEFNDMLCYDETCIELL